MNTTAQDDRAARVIIDWITGGSGEAERVVFCADAAGARAAAPHLTSDDALIAPDAAGTIAASATVVPYTGALDEAGDTLHVAGRSVELQHYLVASFVEIVMPTVVRFPDLAGWLGFLDDADLARRTGQFSSAVVDPRLRLADRDVLADASTVECPRVLHIGREGRVTAGPQGADLGDVRELCRILDTPVPRFTALAGVAPASEVSAGVAERPWLARYLRAAYLIAAAGLESDQRLAGFGWAPLEDGRADAEVRPRDPFLVSTADGPLLVDLSTRRRQRLSESAAVVVGAVQSSASIERATERAVDALEITAGAARALCDEARGLLNVRCGIPVPRPTAGVRA